MTETFYKECSAFFDVGIAGAGQMGAGIAYACAKSGRDVVIYDINEDSLQKSKEIIEKIQEKESVNLGVNIIFSTDLSCFKDVDLVIEAIPENMDLKRDFFKSINSIIKEDTVIASNTSSFSIKNLFEGINKEFIGIHFMNPVNKINLVEIIHHDKCRPELIKKVQKFLNEIGKEGILVKDSPAFIVNRLLIPMINSAVILLDNDIAKADDIDKAMKIGANHPIGPLALADLIGIDTCVSILNELCVELGSCYQPSNLLEEMVEKGYLGRKSGQGFYTYEKK